MAAYKYVHELNGALEYLNLIQLFRSEKNDFYKFTKLKNKPQLVYLFIYLLVHFKLVKS
jgi:hypothetical protein